MATPFSFRRICASTDADTYFLNRLIVEYLKEPSLAETVTEFVLVTNEVEGVHTSTLEPFEHIDEDERATIEEYIRRSTGLSDEPTPIVPPGKTPQPNKPSWHSSNLKVTVQRYLAEPAAVLLSLCPNVTKLYLGQGIRAARPVQDWLFRANYGKLAQPALQKLQHVEFVGHGNGGYDDEDYIDIEFLEYWRLFHRLPAVESVVADGFGSYQPERCLAVPKTSSIKRVHIKHADFDSTILESIVRISRRLEELKISFGGLTDPDGGGPVTYGPLIGKSLLEHKSTLKVLELDVATSAVDPEYHDYSSPSVYEMDGYFDIDRASSPDAPLAAWELPTTRVYGKTIGSLHDFEALTHLSIHIASLIGCGDGGYCSLEDEEGLEQLPPLIDMLPPNLEYLCIYGYREGSNESADGQLRELMDKRAEKLPHLVKVDGVGEPVLDTKKRHPEHPQGKYLWKRPKLDLGWVEA